MIECSRGPGPLLRFGRHTQQYGLNFSLNTRRRLSQLQLSPKKNLNFNSFFSNISTSILPCRYNKPTAVTCLSQPPQRYLK